MSQDNNGNSIISVQVDVEEGKKRVEEAKKKAAELVKKAQKKGEAMVKKAQKKGEAVAVRVKKGLTPSTELDTGICYEDFRNVMEGMDKKECAKLVLWGAKNAENAEVKSYCRKVVGKVGVGTAVTGVIVGWLLS